MDIFGHIKVGKRISHAYRQLFEGKFLIIWYDSQPIIGTMKNGKWYHIDIAGDRELLLFQNKVRYVSFLPSPYEKAKDT